MTRYEFEIRGVLDVDDPAAISIAVQAMHSPPGLPVEAEIIMSDPDRLTRPAANVGYLLQSHVVLGLLDRRDELGGLTPVVVVAHAWTVPDDHVFDPGEVLVDPNDP